MPPPFDSDVLAIEHAGAVATLWLDRPAARNAMGAAFWADLPRAMAAVGDDPDVRAVVVAARGPHFSVGLDLVELAGTLAPEGAEGQSPADTTRDPGPSPAARAATLHAAIVRMQGAIGAVAACAKPVVAAVHGWCIGGGLDLAAACDIRLAAADAVFSLRETRVGIVADLGSLQRLPRIVGAGHAAEMALTGRDVPAARAADIGLVNAVYEDREALAEGAAALAGEIAGLPPLAVQGTKRVLGANDGRSVAEGLAYVAAWNAGMLVSEDLKEALTAFAERRPPRFSGG